MKTFNAKSIAAELMKAKTAKTPEELKVIGDTAAAAAKAAGKTEAEQDAARAAAVLEASKEEVEVVAAPTEAEKAATAAAAKTGNDDNIKKLRAAAESSAALLKALGIKDAAELAGKKLIGEDEWNNIIKERDTFSETVRRDHYAAHPEFQEKFVKPQRESLTNLKNILVTDNGLTEDAATKILTTITTKAGKARLDELAALTKDSLSEFSKADFIIQVRQYDAITASGNRALAQSNEELKKGLEEFKASHDARSIPQKAQLTLELKKNLANPDNFWFQQKETTGLTGDTLAAVKLNNERAAQLRSKAEVLLLGNTTPSKLAEFAAKAVGFDDMASLVEALQAQLDEKEKLLEDIRKAAPDYRRKAGDAAPAVKTGAKNFREIARELQASMK